MNQGHYVVCSTETGGLKFTDEYMATVFETPHPEHDPLLVTDPPTPKTEVVVNATCVNNTGNPVENSTILYSILEGNTALFSIDEVTGFLSVADVPFDYEEQPWYLVHLFCHLNSDPNANGTGTANISIGPLNEFLPTISEFNTIPIPETTPNGTIIAATDHSLGPLATYTVTDRDTGPDGVIIYTLHASRNNSDDRFFELNRESGTLTLNAVLDVDDLPLGFQKLEISITICNMNVPLDICKIADLIVFITAANDIAPMFIAPLYTALVNESELNGTVILEIACMDDDAGADDKVQSITFADGTPTSILTTFELSHELDVGLVNVSLRSELDYENTTDHTFELVCSDGVHTATAQVKVNVLPVNDNLPQFTQGEGYEFTADRIDQKGTIIGTVEATDTDTGGAGTTITYSIVSSSHFSIDEETGEITLKDYLSAGDGSTFDFDVIASDGTHETMTHVRVTATGLLSVLEWIYVGVCAAVLLIILIIIGIIVFYCFIRAAAIVKVVEKYKE